MKSSSKIENFIFFYVNRIFRGSFDNFYKNRQKSDKITVYNSPFHRILLRDGENGKF
jgi:hypothetical protein